MKKELYLGYESTRQASDKLLCAALKLLSKVEDLDDINKSLEQPENIDILNLYRYANFAYEYAEMARDILREVENA